uniref:Ig-like domain-containing protein n=1 Tax=Labrus bergylta TaxID=56723 RepID=A0A3Q3FV74_9LABR
MGVSIVIICIVTGSASLMCVSGRERPEVKCNNSPVKLTAHPGRSVTIQCKFSRADTINARHFCREVEKSDSDCTDLISAKTAEVTRKDRYSLTHYKLTGVYTVVISDLTLEDDGRYRCEVQRAEDNVCLTMIQLQIVDWDDITSTKKTEASGQSVHIVCHYPKSHEKNEKFLCKGKTPFSCEKLIQTTNQERNVEKDRFKIRDNQRLNYFSVNIRFLSTDDSGTYWCGSDTTWQQAEFNKTLLTVVDKKHIKPERSVHSTFDDDDSYSEETDNYENASSGKDAVWIGIGVGGLVLLLVLLVALVLARHKLPRSQVCCPAGRSSVQVTNGGQNTEGNQGEPDYAEIQDQQASSGHVLRTVYATVNPPADQLHYATVNTHKDSLSVCTGKDALPDTNINHCDYSSVMTQSPVHPPGTERIVYSTVSMPGEP